MQETVDSDFFKYGMKNIVKWVIRNNFSSPPQQSYQLGDVVAL